MRKSFSKIELTEGGQALSEFLLSCLLMLSVIGGSVSVLHAAWLKEKCAIEAYEKLREHLNQGTDFRASTEITETEGSLEIRRRCGSVTETIGLKKLSAVVFLE